MSRHITAIKNSIFILILFIFAPYLYLVQYDDNHVCVLSSIFWGDVISSLRPSDSERTKWSERTELRGRVLQNPSPRPCLPDRQACLPDRQACLPDRQASPNRFGFTYARRGRICVVMGLRKKIVGNTNARIVRITI